MKKFLPYLILIIVLGGAATWFILNQTSGTGDINPNAFAVKEQNEVTKVTLTDAEKKKIELTNVNGVWMVNGKFPAREEMINTLFDAITRVTVLCPVPKAGHDNVLREMAAKNVKVEIYKDGEQPVKVYYVGGPTVDGEGTHMILEENGKLMERPYITYIPNLKGYLTLRFNTDEENWRTKVLYNYARNEIEALKVEYPGEPMNSFVINQIAEDSFAVMPVDEKYRINETYEQKYVRQYLDFYSSISFEAFDNTYTKRDSTLKTTPYCIVTITEKDNTVNTVKMYHMPLSKRSKLQIDEKGNDMPYDLEHYHASIHNDKDWVITQYYVFGKILRNYKEFFFKPVAAKP